MNDQRNESYRMMEATRMTVPSNQPGNVLPAGLANGLSGLLPAYPLCS